MPAPSALFHAFLRPPILQILRATGYHSTSPAVLDALTDLAARYLSLLCEKTAEHATHRSGHAGDFSIPEIRLALRDAGALLPEKLVTEEAWTEEEDLRGVGEFVNWFAGQRMREIMEFARGDMEEDETDYLHALKKRHNKTSDDAKFQGTILGKPSDTGDLEIEGGGDLKTINDWVIQRNGGWPPRQGEASPVEVNGTNGNDDEAESPTSDLSSVGDRLDQSILEPPGRGESDRENSAPGREDVKANDDAMDLT